jgi:hypothetical protein
VQLVAGVDRQLVGGVGEEGFLPVVTRLRLVLLEEFVEAAHGATLRPQPPEV